MTINMYATTDYDDNHPTCGSCGCGPCVCPEDPEAKDRYDDQQYREWADLINEYDADEPANAYTLATPSPEGGMQTIMAVSRYDLPPVSGGSDDDETACGALCQDHNDRMWAKLGPVDDVELPF